MTERTKSVLHTAAWVLLALTFVAGGLLYGCRHTGLPEQHAATEAES